MNYPPAQAYAAMYEQAVSPERAVIDETAKESVVDYIQVWGECADEGSRPEDSPS
jgi:hypothetical protein